MRYRLNLLPLQCCESSAAPAGAPATFLAPVPPVLRDSAGQCTPSGQRWSPGQCFARVFTSFLPLVAGAAPGPSSVSPPTAVATASAPTVPICQSPAAPTAPAAAGVPCGPKVKRRWGVPCGASFSSVSWSWHSSCLVLAAALAPPPPPSPPPKPPPHLPFPRRR